MDEVFRALADPGRRRLLDSLNIRDGQTLRQLCTELDITRQAVSKHLAVLEAAGLVTPVRHGREKLHYLNPVPINAIADRWMDRYDRQRGGALADLKRALEEPVNSPEKPEFVYVTYINATPMQLWQALTEPTFISRYYGGGGPRSEWKVGDPVHWSMEGEPAHDWDQVVLASEPGRTLSYTWHGYQPEMRKYFDWSDERFAEMLAEPRSSVTFDIEPAGPGVKLTVSHTGFVPDSEMYKGVRDGWPGILSGLKTVLETGEDLVLAD